MTVGPLRFAARSLAVGAGLVLATTLLADPASAGPSVQEIPIETAHAGPFGVAAGPGRSLWFTESYGDKIGVVDRRLRQREFPLAPGTSPELITAGPDGNMWFTEFGTNGIGRITPSGELREFSIPTPSSGPFGITSGPDGNVWFTESAANRIGRITPTGAITEFQLNPGFNTEGITAGPDGALWYTRFSNPQFPYPGFIGRITTSGAVTEVPSDGIGDPLGIATGPDGNLWVAGPANDVVARVTPGFAITPYRVPGGIFNVPYLIARGPDGAMWFTENGVSEAPSNIGGNKIGRIAMDGHIQQVQAPTASSQPSGITVGPDGDVWFAEQTGDNLGRVLLSR